ncbi:hypothetical protein RRG08_033956 [Elysia crispata]|uniref:Uncharacterized protein n=1 Tax=Elysia crispata TaxID=231223 RepID=A0AAE0YRV5_9GAST|nr:hypothetical protein RRG08_033956 [Elysia crispata]
MSLPSKIPHGLDKPYHHVGEAGQETANKSYELSNRSEDAQTRIKISASCEVQNIPIVDFVEGPYDTWTPQMFRLAVRPHASSRAVLGGQRLRRETVRHWDPTDVRLAVRPHASSRAVLGGQRLRRETVRHWDSTDVQTSS